MKLQKIRNVWQVALPKNLSVHLPPLFGMQPNFKCSRWPARKICDLAEPQNLPVHNLIQEYTLENNQMIKPATQMISLVVR